MSPVCVIYRCPFNQWQEESVLTLKGLRSTLQAKNGKPVVSRQKFTVQGSTPPLENIFRFHKCTCGNYRLKEFSFLCLHTWPHQHFLVPGKKSDLGNWLWLLLLIEYSFALVIKWSFFFKKKMTILTLTHYLMLKYVTRINSVLLKLAREVNSWKVLQEIRRTNIICIDPTSVIFICLSFWIVLTR